MISTLALVFCLNLAVGTSAILLFLRPLDLEPKFFRVNALISIVLLIAAYFLSLDFHMLWLIALLLIYSITVIWMPRLIERLILLAAFVLGFRLLNHWVTGLSLFSTLVGGLLMGAALVGMNVGHWYLSAIKLSIRPLRTATIVIGMLVLIRTLWVLGVIPILSFQNAGIAHDLKTFVQFEGFTMGAAALLRILFGLIGPAILFFLTYGTVKLGSTQSATGILYALLAMVLIGEGSALFITLQTLIPA